MNHHVSNPEPGFFTFKAMSDDNRPLSGTFIGFGQRGLFGTWGCLSQPKYAPAARTFKVASVEGSQGDYVKHKFLGRPYAKVYDFFFFFFSS